MQQQPAQVLIINISIIYLIKRTEMSHQFQHLSSCHYFVIAPILKASAAFQSSADNFWTIKFIYLGSVSAHFWHTLVMHFSRVIHGNNLISDSNKLPTESRAWKWNLPVFQDLRTISPAPPKLSKCTSVNASYKGLKICLLTKLYCHWLLSSLLLFLWLLFLACFLQAHLSISSMDKGTI